jgi:hypothetical protein
MSRCTTGINDTGVVYTGEKFAAGVVDTGGALWLVNIASKKFEMKLMLFSEAWGKMIHEKRLKLQNSGHCPFKVPDVRGKQKQWFSTAAKPLQCPLMNCYALAQIYRLFLIVMKWLNRVKE